MSYFLEQLNDHLTSSICAEYSKDLPTYLKYCRDVVFAGSESSYGNHEEENMIEYLWNFYQNEEVIKELSYSIYMHRPLQFGWLEIVFRFQLLSLYLSCEIF